MSRYLKCRFGPRATVLCAFVSILFCLLFAPVPAAGGNGELSDYAVSAYRHLCDRMDRFGQIYIYRDAAWGGNADYVPSGWMGDHKNLSLDMAHELAPEDTCIRVGYQGGRWAGIYWQRPEKNWGKDRTRYGRDLSGAEVLTFRAKSLDGGARVEFGIGGIRGRTGDSAPKRSRKFTLDEKWKEYEIPLRGLNLSHVVGGFLVVFDSPATVLVDEVRLDLRRDPDRPRMIPSYVVPRQSPLYPVNRNAAHLYDNALALICLAATARSEAVSPELRQDARRRAEILADALVLAQEHDRAYDDGRLRNAYWGGGDFVDHEGRVRLAGWYEAKKKRWLEDRYMVSTYTGNLAWAALALLEAREAIEDPAAGRRYLRAATKLASWIEENTRMEDEWGGYAGGFDGWERTRTNPSGPARLRWRATEHNIDVVALGRRLAAVTGNDRWSAMAKHAERFVMTMFDKTQGHFWTGTLPEGGINKSVVPLDCQTWTLLTLPGRPECRRGIEWAETHLRSTATCGDEKVEGYPFGSAAGGVWPEGTAQMGLAYRELNQPSRSRSIRNALRTIQTECPGGDGKGLVAAVGQPVPTGFDGNKYHPTPHIGATAWFYLLELPHNPLSPPNGGKSK